MSLFDTQPDTLPRWGFNASGVETPGVSVEPAGQLKTSAWEVGRPVRTVMNWLNAKSYQWLGYLDATFGTLFDEDFVARGSDCEVTAGGGARESDIAAGKYWSAGAFYEQSATTLTHDQTVSGDARIDTVVGTASGYAIREGTAVTLPTEPTAPSLTAGDVPLEDVRIEFLTVASRTDRREFGAFRQARLRADTYFRAGDQGGGDYNIEVDGLEDSLTLRADVLTTVVDTSWTITTPIWTLNTSGLATISASDTFGITTTNELYLNGLSGGDVFIGGGTQDVTIGNATGDVIVPAAGVSFPSAQAVTREIHPLPMAVDTGGTAPTNDYPTGVVELSGGGDDYYKLIHDALPQGATITSVVITGNVLSGTNGMTVSLEKHNYPVGISTIGSQSGASGLSVSDPYTITITVSETVEEHPYRLKFLNGAASGHSVKSISLNYTVPALTPAH